MASKKPKKGLIMQHLRLLDAAAFKKKHGMTKAEARRRYGLDSTPKISKDLSFNTNTYTLGGWKSLGRQNRVGQARDGVNESRGRGVNKNLKKG
jgi:hypothetical protein